MAIQTRRSGLTGDEQAVSRELMMRSLSGCRPETITELIDIVRLRAADPQESIYRQGDAVDLTLVLEGHVAFQRTTEDGLQLMAGVAGPGALFGFTSMTPVTSSVDLVTVTACRLAQWRGQELRALAERDPALALHATDALAGSLHDLLERVEGFMHQDSRRRVLRILARHRALFFSDPAILTRAHLPSLVGTTREMTGKVLRQLEREGVVLREGRSGLRLLDPARLDSEQDRDAGAND
jgi:CRP/FNR family transcriptional regulator, cyclic AMP receptor protein